MAPLSGRRADRLVADLVARNPASVVDFGCGWGELLLRVVAASGAHGVGVEVRGADVERGRRNAAARGLSERVTFVEGPAREYAGTADLVLSVGAFHAFDTIAEALRQLRRRVNPGGCLLFAAELWERTPTPEQLAGMWPGATADDCTYLPHLVDEALAAGFRPLRIETATRSEWEDFESGLAAGREDWLLSHPGHPESDAVRDKLDKQRNFWLRGHRDVMGFAYLTLGVPA